MKVLVVGSTGCIGRAVASALLARGHHVVAAARSVSDGPRSLHVDYANPVSPSAWAARLRSLEIDAVVNAVGILMPTRKQSFERIHAQGPIELFRGAALAGLRRVVQVSALGVGPDALEHAYLATKFRADEALAALNIDHAIVRPSLVYGPGSESMKLFTTLAALPLVSLPGRGLQRVQPIHVFEVAESIVRLLEQASCARQTFELGGPHALTYHDMLSTHRQALGLPAPVWLPVPMPLMKLGATLAQVLPQKVYSPDTLRLLERGNACVDNAAPRLLGREPTPLLKGLRVTPATPWIDLRVSMSSGFALALRTSLAVMWLVTASVSALWPEQSGMLKLLERCGFMGPWAVWMTVASCALNASLGLAMLWRPRAWTYALQACAVVGYTVTAAWNAPELTVDHCGPLLKNLPLLAMILMLWNVMPASRANAGDAPRRSSSRSTSKATSIDQSRLTKTVVT